MVTQQRQERHIPIYLHGEPEEEETSTELVIASSQGVAVSPEQVFVDALSNMALSIFDKETPEEQAVTFVDFMQLFSRLNNHFNITLGNTIRTANERQLYRQAGAGINSMEQWLVQIGTDPDIIKRAKLYMRVVPFLVERNIPLDFIADIPSSIHLEAIEELMDKCNRDAAKESTRLLGKNPTLEQRREKEEEFLKEAEPNIQAKVVQISGMSVDEVKDEQKSQSGELIRAFAILKFFYNSDTDSIDGYVHIPRHQWEELYAGLTLSYRFKDVPDKIDARKLPFYAAAVKEYRDPATCLDKPTSTASPIRPTTVVTGTLQKQSHEEPEEFPVWQGDDEEYEAEFAEDGEEQEI